MSRGNRRDTKSAAARRESKRDMLPNAARAAAMKIIGEARSRQAYVRPIIAQDDALASLSPSDKAFAERLIYGVVSCEGTLDKVIDSHLREPSRTAPAVRDALRIATYELLFLGKQPHAAVSQGVALCAKVAPYAKGLANAVLRKVAADAEEFPFGDPDASDAALAISLGFPEWLCDELIGSLGRAGAKSLMQTSNEQGPVFLAENVFLSGNADAASGHVGARTQGDFAERMAAQGIEVEPTRIFGCHRAINAQAAATSDAVASGEAIIADAASQLVTLLAAPRNAGPFLEVGCGRGTKTALLQVSAFRERGACADIWAIDNSDFKIAVHAKRMAALGVPGTRSIVADGTRIAESLDAGQGFAGALVDAPCSGLGTLRRHPEKRWRVAPQDIDSLAKTQLSMLKSAAGTCRVGAALVYSTCTVLRQEDEDVIDAFLASAAGDGWEIADISCELGDELAEWVTPEGFLRTVASQDGPDAHFAAKLVRKR